MGDFFQRIPIADARPRIFPKVTTSGTVGDLRRRSGTDCDRHRDDGRERHAERLRDVHRRLAGRPSTAATRASSR